MSSSAPYTSAAPIVTTLVPTGGPPESSARFPSIRSTSTSSRTKVSGLGLVKTKDLPSGS